MPIRIALLFLLIAAARAPHADEGLRPDGALDTAAVRDAYLRSDMPWVQSTLEGFIKSHPRGVPAPIRSFTHLYLGASYAGEADARAKAEAHFRAALKLDPAIDPADLYLAPAVRDWFEGLRAEARLAQAQATATPPASAAPEPVPAPPPAGHVDPPVPSVPPAPEDTSTAVARRPPAPAPDAAVAAPQPGRSWVWWTLGSAAAATAAGVGAFAYVQSHTAPAPRRVQVDATLK